MEKINENQRFYTSHWWWSNILEKRYEQIGISLDHCAVRFNQQLDHWDILILVALDLRVPLRGHDKGTNWQGRNWKWHGDCMSIGNVEDCLLQSWSKFKYESYRFIPIIPVLTNRGHSRTISNRKTASKHHLNSYMTRVAERSESFIQIPPSLSPPTKRMVLGVDSSISMSLMMLWWCSMTWNRPSLAYPQSWQPGFDELSGNGE